MDFWNQIPSEWRSWLVGTLPAWVGLAFAAVGTYYARRAARRPLTRITFDLASWTARRERGEVRISGHVHYQPLGAGYTVMRVLVAAWWDPWSVVRKEFELPRGTTIGWAHQGMGQDEYNFQIPDRRTKRITVRVRVELADGTKSTMTRAL